jgi:hypothetical protein
VDVEVVALQAKWEREELPKAERRAAAFWRQRERFVAEWRKEEAHLIKRLADISAKLVEAAPPQETAKALRRRCGAMEETVFALCERRFKIRVAELQAEPPRQPRPPRQQRQPRVGTDGVAAADGASDAGDEDDDDGLPRRKKLVGRKV